MIKVTLFTTGESCQDIGSANAAHVTMFDKQEIVLHFLSTKEQLMFIEH